MRPKRRTDQATEMTELEKIAKGVQDVLAISRQGRQASRATRNRGSNGSNFANYKCYNCNQMGHLHRQYPKLLSKALEEPGGPTGRGFTTRRGRFRQNFGPSRARPFFGRPPGRSMMEIEAEEFWGGETNQFHP